MASTQVKTDEFTVNATGLRKCLLSAFKVKRPVFVWGGAGIGKSAVVAQIANDLGGLMVDIRLSQMDPTDIRGIPFFNKEAGKMDWAPPIDLPDQELASKYPVVVLFLDEMNSAPPAVQAAAYQLILDRRVGKYVLPDNVVVVAAGNRESDRGVTYRLPSPLANRLVHVELAVDFQTWQTWAVLNGVHKDVVGYLSFAKNDLHDFDGRSASRAFPTPRSWSFVSDILQDEGADADTQFALIAGAVGSGLAVKFSAHRKTAGKMPNPTDILSGKVKTLAVKEISAMYSLTISLCYELKDAFDKKKVDSKQFHEMGDNFLRFMMDNFETELCVMGSRLALKVYELKLNPFELKVYEEFYAKYGKFIRAATAD